MKFIITAEIEVSIEDKILTDNNTTQYEVLDNARNEIHAMLSEEIEYQDEFKVKIKTESKIIEDMK